MIEERVQYGIENFLEEHYFLPANKKYCLEEKSESGRSELQVEIEEDNLCSSDYDNKGKCNFLRKESKFKLKRSVDHVILQKKNEKWILHFIEMKSQVDNKKWHEIKQKVRASYFNFFALESVLGIHIDEVCVYTTYEQTRFSELTDTTNPKAFVLPLGKPTIPIPRNEWENGVISVDIGEIVRFKHEAIKMNRTADGTRLTGRLQIE